MHPPPFFFGREPRIPLILFLFAVVAAPALIGLMHAVNPAALS
jgi:hypothetical protein